MIRTVSFPLPREEVFRVLGDPIALMVWLDAPSITTGTEELHVFEVSNWRSPSPWRVRGAVVECNPPRKLVIETDPDKKKEKGTLTLQLQEEEGGCRLSLEWSSPGLDRLAAAFLDPVGIARLTRTLGSPAMRP